MLLTPSLKTSVAVAGPAITLWIAYLILPVLASLPPFAVNLLNVSPYFVFLIGTGLALFFGRGTIFFIMFSMLASYALFDAFLSQPEFSAEDRASLIGAAGFLIPFNLLGIYCLTEQKSLVSARNFAILLILAVQVVLIFWLYGHQLPVLRQIVTFTPEPEQGLFSWLHMPLLAFVMFLVTLSLVVVKFLRDRSVINAGFVWATAAIFIGLNGGAEYPQFPVYMALAGLIVIFSLIQTWYDIAYLDQLTGLPGRLALNEMMKTLHGNYVIAMVDIDYFKKINDTYGHDVGDQVLKLVAAKLRTVGGGGKSFRYGGEEFTIVFNGKTTKEVFSTLSDLRERIAETQMILRQAGRPAKKPDVLPRKIQPLRFIHVTVSIGIADSTTRAGHTVHPETVIKAADEALYRAKERGRNRLSF